MGAVGADEFKAGSTMEIDKRYIMTHCIVVGDFETGKKLVFSRRIDSKLEKARGTKYRGQRSMREFKFHKILMSFACIVRATVSPKQRHNEGHFHQTISLPLPWKRKD